MHVTNRVRESRAEAGAAVTLTPRPRARAHASCATDATVIEHATHGNIGVRVVHVRRHKSLGELDRSQHVAVPWACRRLDGSLGEDELLWMLQEREQDAAQED